MTCLLRLQSEPGVTFGYDCGLRRDKRTHRRSNHQMGDWDVMTNTRKRIGRLLMAGLPCRPSWLRSILVPGAGGDSGGWEMDTPASS